MSENQNKTKTTAIAEVVPVTPVEQVLTSLQKSDYSDFLYETNFGGKRGKEFTAEGIKTLGLNNGISTGPVQVEFLDPEKMVALFHCTATDANGNTSERVVKQCELENGRVNPHWIEKGCARAERNAIKARIPVQLFKTALRKAISAGEAKQSAIIELQRKSSIAWAERDESLCHIDKKAFFTAAQREYGESDQWDAETWRQITADLQSQAEWVKDIQKSPF